MLTFYEDSELTIRLSSFDDYEIYLQTKLSEVKESLSEYLVKRALARLGCTDIDVMYDNDLNAVEVPLLRILFTYKNVKYHSYCLNTKLWPNDIIAFVGMEEIDKERTFILRV